VLILVTLLGQCEKSVQERMIWHFTQCDPEWGARVAEGLGISLDAVPDFTEEFATRIGLVASSGY